jgi:hypothetical protein
MRDGSDMQQAAQTRPRYTLALAMLIVRQIETSSTRQAVFEEIKAKNRIIHLVDHAYTWGGAFLIRPLMLCLYMLKCAGSFAGRPASATRALAMANFDNEVHTIERIKALVPNVEIFMIRPSIRNAMMPAQLFAMARMIGLVPRIWRLLSKLSTRYDFMPACRISSALAYYVRFGEMFDEGPAEMAGIVASNYSPEAVGLAAAAHHRGRKVIYVNHAPVPRNSPYVPPVLADVSIFYGDAVRETYALRSRCVTQPAYIGQPGKAAEMVFDDTLTTVGIFLTALTRKETIARLITEIRAMHPATRILIRHHPVALLETDLSDLTDKNPNIEVTIGTPLDGDIAACDVIVCGNSGVILNALRGGRPVAYAPELDALPLDYNGFLEGGLVPRIDGWDAETLVTLKSFYSTHTWQDIMTTHDASYGQTSDVLAQKASNYLLTVLGPRS